MKREDVEGLEAFAFGYSLCICLSGDGWRIRWMRRCVHTVCISRFLFFVEHYFISPVFSKRAIMCFP